MQFPIVSIIVPCYNQAEFLDECLQSVLHQTYADWECIIVNDGSPDNTEDVALTWTAEDSRFKYLKKENGGLSSARNAGIEMAKGEWILPLDCDDKISKDYLKLAAERFKENPTIIYCEGEYFGEKNGKIDLPDYNYKHILIENIIFCTAFFKKKDWMKVKGFDENMQFGFEDWEFWLKILEDVNSSVIKLEACCFFYRTKKNSMLTALEGENKKMMKNYISGKHSKKYEQEFGTYHDVIKRNKSLETQVKHAEKILNSKRHLWMNKFFSLFES